MQYAIKQEFNQKSFELCVCGGGGGERGEEDKNIIHFAYFWFLCK